MTVAEITPTQFVERRQRGESLTLLDVREEWEHVRQRVGLIDLSSQGLLRVVGPDRRTWLHGMVTNGAVRRSLQPCMAAANTFFPVPLSPVSRTVTSDAAAWRMVKATNWTPRASALIAASSETAERSM